ncbi:hypothetical protein Taro_049417 [Colocasia esculenta]|uniref:DUF4219 domain-containing protein n=1 Tax=Colocasia esculenta TaxID=4460 RepID=A0A843XB01_COLES|nr:hypothetical protein [Colocasia esculenta]
MESTKGYMAEGHSVTRPPFFDGTDYPYWKNRMHVFLRAQNIELWKIVSKGAYTLPQDEDTWTKDQIAKRTLNWSALNMMQCTVHPKEYSRVSTCTSAKEMWDKLELIYEGTSVVRESKVSMLVSEYEMFKMNHDETISDMFSRFMPSFLFLHLCLIPSMAPKAKKLVSRRRPASFSPGEGSKVHDECRTKHRDDRLPELVVPPRLHLTRVHGTFTKFVPPHYVDFHSLADLFSNLQPLFDTQGWTVFLYAHTAYSPTAVTEFFNNLASSDQAFYTSGKGTPFKLTANLFSTALQIPNTGADILDHHPDASVYYPLLTLQPYDNTTKIAKLNANTFPPLNRMIHQIFTTCIALKHGNRELVTNVHKSLFTFFLDCEPINLPLLMLRLITQCFYQPRRSMPFACPITSLLKFIGIPIPDSECVSLNSRNSFDITAATRMGYKLLDGVVTRELKGKAPAAAEDEDSIVDADQTANEEDDEDCQSEPLDAPGDAGVDVAAQPSIRNLIAQLQVQMTHGFERLNARMDTLDTRLDRLATERHATHRAPEDDAA